jgi:translation initiation factor 2A
LFVKINLLSQNYLIYYFSVKIIDAETAQPVSIISKKQIVEIGFSPKGTYISTWERPGSPSIFSFFIADRIGSNPYHFKYVLVKLTDGSVHKNLIIWEVKTGKELISFTQKSQNNWLVKFRFVLNLFCMFS